MNFQQELKNVRAAYQDVQEDIEVFKEGLMKPLQDKAAKLEEIVSQEFGKLLKELGPLKNGYPYADHIATVSKYDVDYLYDPPTFTITIRALSVKNRGVHVSREVDKTFLGGLTGEFGEEDPRVTKFKRDFSVGYIYFGGEE